MATLDWEFGGKSTQLDLEWLEESGFRLGGVPELDDEKEPARAIGRLVQKTGGWHWLVMHKAHQTIEQCG